MEKTFNQNFEKAYAAAEQQAKAAGLSGGPYLNWAPAKQDREMMRAKGKNFVAYAHRPSSPSDLAGYKIIHAATGRLVEQDVSNKWHLPDAQRAAEETLRRFESLKATPAQVKSALSKLNADLDKTTKNHYFPGIPLVELTVMAGKRGFWAGDFSSIASDKGREIIDLAYPGSERQMTLTVSWHKMDVSGRYEVVAYAN